MIRTGFSASLIATETYTCMLLTTARIELKSMTFKRKIMNECILGVINNICSHEHPENTTLGTSTLELHNTTINVIWSQADFTELYLVLQKGKLRTHRISGGQRYQQMHATCI